MNKKINAIDNIYLYKHKSDPTYYACATQATNIKKYRSKDNYVVFYRLYGLKLKLAAASDLILYSDYATKVDLLNLLKIHFHTVDLCHIKSVLPK